MFYVAAILFPILAIVAGVTVFVSVIRFVTEIQRDIKKNKTRQQ